MYIKDLIEKLILEEIEKLAPVNISKESNIAMNCDDFIRLTTPSSNLEATLDDIKARTVFMKNQNIKIDEKFAPYIKINNENQVVEHEGRARFYYFTYILGDDKNKNDAIEINIEKEGKFLSSKDRDLPRVIYSQGDGKFKVSKEYSYNDVIYSEFDEETEIRIPTSIDDLESDIDNSDLGEMNEKFRDKDYARAAYELSGELDYKVRKNPIEALKYYGDVLLFIYNNPSFDLEDPMRYLARESLVENGLETNKNLIISIYKDVGNEVGKAFAHAVLDRKEDAIRDLGWVIKDPEERKSRRDDIDRLIDWIESKNA